MSSLRSPVDGLRRHPAAADALLAGLLTAVAFVTLAVRPDSDLAWRDLDVFAVLLTAGALVPLAWRRRHPAPVFVVTLVCALTFAAVPYGNGAESFGVLIGLYTLAAHCPPRRSLLGLLAALIAVAIVMLRYPGDVGPAELVGNAVVFVTAWALGNNLRTRRAYTAELEERAAGLERERAAQTLVAVTTERRRIARELHDVVAHNVSVMVVQAGAARRMVDRDPAAACAAIEAVEATGRAAMTEMRRLVDVLREDNEPSGELVPQPGVDQVPVLIEAIRGAGLPVELVVEGEPRSLPPGLDLSAYRIVQEALTNTLKHAGRATARVLLRYGDEGLDVYVDDNGRGPSLAADASEHAGHGLLGMRERIALFGGQLAAGPRRGGGYQVVARLPFERKTA